MHLVTWFSLQLLEARPRNLSYVVFPQFWKLVNIWSSKFPQLNVENWKRNPDSLLVFQASNQVSTSQRQPYLFTLSLLMGVYFPLFLMCVHAVLKKAQPEWPSACIASEWGCSDVFSGKRQAGANMCCRSLKQPPRCVVRPMLQRGREIRAVCSLISFSQYSCKKTKQTDASMCVVVCRSGRGFGWSVWIVILCCLWLWVCFPQNLFIFHLEHLKCWISPILTKSVGLMYRPST